MKLRKPSKTQSLIVMTGIAFIYAPSAHAQPAAPPQQSQCEVEMIIYKAKHPNADTFEHPDPRLWFGDGSPPGPSLSYRDVDSGTTLYVESDGRHVAAIDKDGKLLWVRNPFVDSNLCPYRSAHPYISWIGPPGGTYGRHYLGPFTPTPDAKANIDIEKELNREFDDSRKGTRPAAGSRFIGLSFNTTQMGYLNIQDGEFYFMGQD